ncbi:MAG: Holliday junction branch migration protein RuvA [Bacteroidales bacterium]|nr:Holliday junction branch migration protein RuvA [Bacteroidales bacterium]
MFEFIEGKIEEITPAHLVLQAGGIGYFINISLFTYSALQNLKEAKVFIHQVVREDAHLLFGFHNREERTMFRLLISVNGIGPNTARVILSSVSSSEAELFILEGNVKAFQDVKGIGLKTAQRIIVDLKDKVGKGGVSADLFRSERNTIFEESLSALVALGFVKKQAEKVLGNILVKNPECTVEEAVKQSLKIL